MATSTRTRKPAAKPVEDAGTEQAPAVPDFTTSSTPVKPEKRKALFSINGEPFTVPETIGERYVFLGMDKVRTAGATFAVMYLVELLLGPEQYARLLAHYERAELTEEQFDQVIGMVSDLFFDRMKATPDAEGAGGKAPAANGSTTS